MEQEDEAQAALEDGVIEKKRMKKKRDAGEVREEDVVVEEGEEEKKERKKKKKEKKRGDAEMSKKKTSKISSSSSSSSSSKINITIKTEPVEVNDETNLSVTVSKEKQKKRRNRTDEEKAEDVATLIKKAIRVKMERETEESTEETPSDVVFLSARPGNQDEMSIDQERRLALQRDVDEESRPKAATFGQWGSAQFESSDRQTKFLRLMGGFKKGGQPVGQPVGQSSRRFNMALGTEDQQTLQQGLMGQFERAQNRRMDVQNRGVGLGFTAPSNKKFAIDVNARNSVKFDD